MQESIHSSEGAAQTSILSTIYHRSNFQLRVRWFHHNVTLYLKCYHCTQVTVVLESLCSPLSNNHWDQKTCYNQHFSIHNRSDTLQFHLLQTRFLARLSACFEMICYCDLNRLWQVFTDSKYCRMAGLKPMGWSSPRTSAGSCTTATRSSGSAAGLEQWLESRKEGTDLGVLVSAWLSTSHHWA